MIRVAITLTTDGESCVGCDNCDAAIEFCKLFHEYLYANSRNELTRCQSCRDAEI